MNSNTASELLAARQRLLAYAESFDSAPEKNSLDAICSRSVEIGKSASGSWIGYHANIYYGDFAPPPPGVYFNVDGNSAFSGQDPNWIERSAAEVFGLIVDEQSMTELAAAEKRAEDGLVIFNNVREDVSSLLTLYLENRDDKFVRRIAEEIATTKVMNGVDITYELSPKRKLATRDFRAIQQGAWVPPHINVQARISAATQPAANCRKLAGKLGNLAAHLARAARHDERTTRIGMNVFIGHGQSFVWRDLKDFIQERLRLPVDEFNRVPVAGVANTARLSEMLDSAACAFVIMTAEDEMEDGRTIARMNVIHEVGLFQGRLGFNKAIVLLEEGCEEFSNIQGLGQIRFPKGNVAAKFEEIRRVLEREHVIEGQKGAA